MTNIPTFLGCAPADASQIIPYTEKFDILYDDGGEMKLITKETYSTEADEDMPEFKYKYVLNCMDLQVFGSEEKSIVIQCLMCPLPEYVNKETLKEITNEVDYYFSDATSSGVLPNMGDEYINYDPEQIPEDENGNRWYDYYYYLTNNKDFVQVLNVAATMIDSMNDLRGWRMDRVWNQIGSTGWDLLRYLLIGENWTKKSINRLMESEANK
ncbi:hypothetical protein [Blautia intestinalis]|uniref:hypothetical protein n=1 Tax=Blautia intestinalis TaxID=2763028 RepID=UPI0022DF4793|nr:hypothetical protein [Blautia intestinalis]